MQYRLIITSLFAALLFGCTSPHGRDNREFRYGLDGEKLYIGRAAGTGDTFTEAQKQALLLAAAKAVGVEVKHVRSWNGEYYCENTKIKIQAISYRIDVREQRTLDDGRKRVRIYAEFQVLSEIPLNR